MPGKFALESIHDAGIHLLLTAFRFCRPFSDQSYHKWREQDEKGLLVPRSFMADDWRRKP